jgi:6-phosphogluconate dehydrogenase
MNNDNIERDVLLLAIYKKKENETINDILQTMEDGSVFTIKTGKKYIKDLKQLQYLNENGLTFIGVEEAKKIELQFKI